VLGLTGFLDLLRRAGVVRGPATVGGGENRGVDNWWEQVPSYRFDLKVGRLSEGEACAAFTMARMPEIAASEFQVPHPPVPARQLSESVRSGPMAS
jgi:hypothetical protein